MPNTVSPPGARRGLLPLHVLTLAALLTIVFAAASPLLLAPCFGQDEDGSEQKHTYVQDGQEYEVTAPSRQDTSKFGKMATAGKFGNKEEQRFFEGYLQYYVQRLTWKETIDSKFPDKRTDLKKILRNLGKTAGNELHDRANQLTLDACRKVAEDPDQESALRYNCVLMIGDLDNPESAIGRLAVPWTKATDELLAFLSNPKQDLAVRLPAVIALDHQVSLGLPADARTKLADVLAKVLKDPVADVAEGQQVGQNWLRWSSAKLMESLAEKGAAVDKSVMAAALVALAADEKVPVWMRCEAAAGLGKIEARELSALEIQPTVQMLAELLVTSLAASPFVKLAELSEEAEKVGDDKEGKEDKGKENAAVRVQMTEKVRHMNASALLAEIDHVRIGLAGVSAPTSRSQPRTSTTAGLYAAADDDAKKSIGQLLEHLDAAIKVLRGDGDLATISNSVVDTRDNIQTILAEGIEPSTAAAKSEPRRTGGPPAGNNPATSPVRQ